MTRANFRGFTRRLVAFWRIYALVAFVVVVALRLPHILEGRFWAEEGRDYFAFAWTLPWWQALFKPEVGYLNLPATASPLIARYAVPLEGAPLVTTILALFFQSIPALILVSARDPWLRSPWVLLAALALLATPPGGDEVWINTPTSQFHLAVAAALCLALEVPAQAGAWIRGIFLGLAPLCSPVTAALAPLFLARAWLERDRRRAIQGLAVLIGAAIQFLLFYSSMKGRWQIPGPSVVASLIAARHIALPLLGLDLARVVAGDLQESIHAAHRPLVAFLVVAAVGGLVGAGIYFRRMAVPFWLLIAALVIAGISYAGALDGRVDSLVTVDGQQRYTFAPSVLFGLTILSLAATRVDRVAAISWLFCTWLFVVGFVQASLPRQRDFATGPAWAEQVSRWRADHGVALAIWPYGWTMRLPVKQQEDSRPAAER
jgi:hypothetical protein